MCNITIDITGKNADEVYETAKQEIQAHGSFQQTGNRSLDFIISIPLAGKIEGNLHVEDKQALVNITKRPGLISCNRIEKEIRRFLDSGNE